jgi:phosphatidylserine decarboxylase
LQSDDMAMTLRAILLRILRHEDVNFLLTNRIPRRFLTLLVGRLSRVANPWVVASGLALWRLSTDLDLSEAKEQKFRTLREVFIRELREGSRTIAAAPNMLVSPCDAIVGASGRIADGMLLQIKGSPYSLQNLLCDAQLQARYRNGQFVTLRLTAGMYHRFHAPHDCRVRQVNYISGDTWNVNPIALRRIEALFCRNERAVVQCELTASAQLITLVPVAAILVASIRLHCLSRLFHLRHRGSNVFHCNAPFRKGEEMGWFELGSTIVVLAPEGSELVPAISEGSSISMGDALLRLFPDLKDAATAHSDNS